VLDIENTDFSAMSCVATRIAPPIGSMKCMDLSFWTYVSDVRNITLTSAVTAAFAL